MPYLPILTLALHKVFVLACIAQHFFVGVGANLAMCHCEARQFVFEIDVIGALPCFVEFKDSSIHDLLARLLEQGLKHLLCRVNVSHNEHWVASLAFVWWTQQL